MAKNTKPSASSQPRRMRVVTNPRPPKVPQVGAPVRLVAMGSARSCANSRCARPMKRGIVYQHNDALFCSRGCAAAV